MLRIHSKATEFTKNGTEIDTLVVCITAIHIVFLIEVKFLIFCMKLMKNLQCV